MEHIWSVLCSKAIIDRRTNLLSLIETMDAIEFSESGLQDMSENQELTYIWPVSIQIVGFWYRSDPEKAEKGQGRLKVIAPNGKEIGPETNLELNLEGTISTRTLVEMDRFPYAGFGLYKILVEKMGQEKDAWREVASLPVLLRKRAEETES